MGGKREKRERGEEKELKMKISVKIVCFEGLIKKKDEERKREREMERK